MKLFSLIAEAIKNRIYSKKDSTIVLYIFFIIGILLTIQSLFYHENEDFNANEYGGVLGYFTFIILNQLFGVVSYFIGPLFLFLTFKAYIKQNHDYLLKGFIGIILFLFFFSFFIAIFDPSRAGFIGLRFLDFAYVLIGKKGTFIIVTFFLIVSIFQIFSIRFDDLKNFLVSITDENKKIDFKKLIEYFIILFSVKVIFDKIISSFQRKTIQTEPHIKNQFNKSEEAMNFKKLFSWKKTDGSSIKMPWIQKIEINEEEIQDSENLLEPLETENYIHEKEESKNLPQENTKQELIVEKGNGWEYLQEKNQIHLPSENTNAIFSRGFKIVFDKQKNRYIFVSNEDEVKKKLSIEKNKNLLIDLELDEKISDIIKKSVKENNREELQNYEEKPQTLPILQEEKIETVNVNIMENIEQEKSIPSTSEKSEKNEILSLEKKDNLEILKKEAPSEISIKKLQELQEQIITSDQRYPLYQLSLKNLKDEDYRVSHMGNSIQREIQENWQRLEKVLSDYGIRGQVVGATRGPMITMYEVRLEPGVRVNRVQSLQDEICMNLASVSVRILAPIPGKSTIGIEIPNKNREFVNLGELVHKDPEFFSKKRDINIPLGKDVFGKTRYIDLTRLPHLLIAGATGSGKSVFMNSIIASLLYQYSPEMIRFLMIDPKMVELKLYEGIPHLLYPVIIDVKMASKALNWAVEEMENRYRLFSLTKCRDIRSYNEKITKNQISGNSVPYIIIFIDELSDLMMVSAKEVEDSIIRLTQKARAVGIHMILATQRPSVDVITALIKANCPARISFQVSQKVDSRIILDTNGAETLLGKGDLLYRSPASTLPFRIQSPFITEEEIENIVKETQKYPFYGYIDLPVEEEASFELGINDVDEQLIQKAWQIILETGKTSTSFVQRKLRIGYNRAATIMEKLEEMGYLSPAYGSKPREILKRN